MIKNNKINNKYILLLLSKEILHYRLYSIVIKNNPGMKTGAGKPMYVDTKRF